MDCVSMLAEGRLSLEMMCSLVVWSSFRCKTSITAPILGKGLK